MDFYKNEEQNDLKNLEVALQYLIQLNVLQYQELSEEEKKIKQLVEGKAGIASELYK
jgi:helix-turn-helix protein